MSTDPAAALAKTWEAAERDLTPCAAYVAARGLPADVLNTVSTDALRFAPALPYFDTGEDGKPVKVGDFPAILAKVTGPAGEVVTLHRTYLAGDGAGKLDAGEGRSAKKLMRPVEDGATRGAAIRLWPAGSVHAVAEGIETALAVRAATGMACWPCVSAQGLERVELPGHVQVVHIWADNDSSGTGQKAAEAAAGRLQAEGRTVHVHLPANAGEDWLDVYCAHGPDALLDELTFRDEWAPAGQPKTRLLEVLTAAELLSLTPERPEWIAHGLVARYCISDEVAGPKVGKTTFNLMLSAAVAAGLPFLGESTTRTRVLYLTEERGPTFRAALERAGVTGDGIRLVLRQAGFGWTWPELVQAAAEAARNADAGLLVIDSLADWASLAGDAENSSGAVLEALRPVQAAAAEGLAVLLVRHDSKGAPRELGEAGRGSNAAAGACDILLGLRKTLGAGHENRRRLDYAGRFDGIPGARIIEWRPEAREYLNLGSEADIEKREARSLLLDTLTVEPLTEKEILDCYTEEERPKRSTFQRAIHELIDQEQVEKSGEGKRGRPFRYARKAVGAHAAL